jgi:hypothetical protein
VSPPLSEAGWILHRQGGGGTKFSCPERRTKWALWSQHKEHSLSRLRANVFGSTLMNLTDTATAQQSERPEMELDRDEPVRGWLGQLNLRSLSPSGGA